MEHRPGPLPPSGQLQVSWCMESLRVQLAPRGLGRPGSTFWATEALTQCPFARNTFLLSTLQMTNPANSMTSPDIFKAHMFCVTESPPSRPDC